GWCPGGGGPAALAGARNGWGGGSAPPRGAAPPPAAATASTRAAVMASPTTTSRAPMIERDAKVPVLTEVVPEAREPRPAVNAVALEALARELERAVLVRLAPEIDRVIGQALDGVRTELTISVTPVAREAVAASVAQPLQRPDSK